jgi:hypothetical protein
VVNSWEFENAMNADTAIAVDDELSLPPQCKTVDQGTQFGMGMKLAS